VACIAIHRRAIEIDVGQRCLVFVASRAHTGVDPAEIGLRRVVALVAVDALVDHVLGMSRRETNVGPIGVNEPGIHRGVRCLELWHDYVRELCIEKTTREPEHRKNRDDDCGSLHRPPE